MATYANEQDVARLALLATATGVTSELITADGKFELIDSAVGATLLIVILAYGRGSINRQSSRFHTAMYSGAIGLSIMCTFGVLLAPLAAQTPSGVYTFFVWTFPASDALGFALWFVASVVCYVLQRWEVHKLLLRFLAMRTRVAPQRHVGQAHLGQTRVTFGRATQDRETGE